MNISLRAYLESDLVRLSELFTETVHRINCQDYAPAQIMAWAPNPPDLDRWRRRLLSLKTTIATVEQRVVGFCSMEGTNHLELLYVDYAHQGQGVARALVESALREAGRKGESNVFTEASITACPCFERLGFRLIQAQEVLHSGIPFRNFRMAYQLNHEKMEKMGFNRLNRKNPTSHEIWLY